MRSYVMTLAEGSPKVRKYLRGIGVLPPEAPKIKPSPPPPFPQHNSLQGWKQLKPCYQYKRCSKCWELLPRTPYGGISVGFRRDRSKSDGLSSQCKGCDREYRERNREYRSVTYRAWYADNREYAKARSRAWYEDNREYAKAWSRAWYEDNREYAKARSRAYYEDNRDEINAKARARLAEKKRKAA